MLTATDGAFDDSGRPSVGRTSAFGNARVARICGPGRLWKVAANWTATFGIRYDPYAFTCVRNFVSTWQYSVLGLSSFVTTSQLSVDVRPELTPPAAISPCRGRALTPMSTPFQ